LRNVGEGEDTVLRSGYEERAADAKGSESGKGGGEQPLLRETKYEGGRRIRDGKRGTKPDLQKEDHCRLVCRGFSSGR